MVSSYMLGETEALSLSIDLRDCTVLGDITCGEKLLRGSTTDAHIPQSVLLALSCYHGNHVLL